MKPIPDLPYPADELSHLQKLSKLFEDWHACFTTGASQLDKHIPDEIVCDGFYPHYFNQQLRILYIGRESRQISGLNYLEVLFPAYRTGKKIGDRSLNADKFHSRMLRITHGLLNGTPDWSAIPSANEIGDTFGTEAGISFAFMNLSKLSNEADEWQSDWSAIEAAHLLSNETRRFSEEEIAILKPHIVITMKLGEKLKSLGSLQRIESQESVTAWQLDSAGHRSLLIDTFHFSAWSKHDVRDFYGPIGEVVAIIRRNIGECPCQIPSHPADICP
ncbi:MAG: hypothetical protein K9N47_27725 [Prosthecobacter sp.]|uniref:hypothetical protein n=1 Tax=Prosthecobacter sp. TaxID=1965333 RepID=UPI002614332B|nr:hypothetical protein [Prosthecobacter sp.]MCF7789944.1 hypothetical protein [Prosthecobacter sp.]